jgi:hypothetical protein
MITHKIGATHGFDANSVFHPTNVGIINHCLNSCIYIALVQSWVTLIKNVSCLGPKVILEMFEQCNATARPASSCAPIHQFHAMHTMLWHHLQSTFDRAMSAWEADDTILISLLSYPTMHTVASIQHAVLHFLLPLRKHIWEPHAPFDFVGLDLGPVINEGPHGSFSLYKCSSKVVQDRRDWRGHTVMQRHAIAEL